MSKKIKSKMVQEPTVPQTITEVLTVFNEINKVQSASKAQIFQLVRLFRGDPQGFKSSFQLAYLKIFKIFHERGNRKMPPKYEQLASSLFQEILSKDSEGSASELFNYFLSFLAEGIFSSLAGIRVTSGRMLFHLIKQGSSSVDQNARISVLRSVYYLLRLKVSTYKQIGIKLASLVLGWEHDLKSKIQYELFKILAVDQNQQIRKLAITNVYLNPNNLDKVLLRLRDKSADIRSIVLKKLIGQRYKLQDMSVGNRIHLLYDGYGNKQASIQQETLRYFSKFFQQGTRRQSFTTFIQYFRPNLLLLYPHIYTLFDNLIASIIQDMPVSTISEFTQDSTNDLKQMSKSNMIRPSFREFIWLKNIGKSDRSEIRAIFQECVPSGLELSRVLQQLMNGKDLFSLYQCLQIFSLQKSSDEMGRNKMFDSLKKAVLQIQFFQHQQKWQTLQTSDICPPLSEQLIKQRKMMLSYFDLPLISNSFDLLYQLGNAMKALWPDHYEIQLKQIMAEWNDPQENTLIKQKQMARGMIQKLRAEGNTRLVSTFEEKITAIEVQLIKQSYKTRSIVLILNRLRPSLSMQDFMPIIRQDLGKQQQSQGLILLALYCLQQLDRVKSFLPLYWIHLNPTEQRNKLHLMVSLKALTDFIVKFDLKDIKIGQQDEISYHNIIRKIQELVLDNDPDIRILAIEGLCRIIYHNRVPDDLLSSCFVRLLLLWWETGSQEVSAKSVHTISIFVKQYIERGPSQVRKLAQSLCIFFKVLLLKQSEGKTISKLKITYNLKLQEFVKRAIVIAMTVLKYHKESRQVIWKYQQSGAQLGPQEMFLLFLFKQENLHYTIEKAINICDFYEDAPLQTIILIKKQVQKLVQDLNFANRKNLQNMLKKLDKDLEQRIQIKNQETFNNQLLQGLRSQLKQHEFLIKNAAVRLGEQLENSQIFVKNQPFFNDIKAENKQISEDEDMEGVIELIEQVNNNLSSEQLPNKKKKKQLALKRISEGIQQEDLMQLEKEEEEVIRKQKQEQNKRRNRKKAPLHVQEQSINSSSKPIKAEQIAPARTRSRKI